MTLQLGRHAFADDATLMMAIVNRTPDSFYDRGATWAEDKAFDRVAQVVAEGAEIVDIGGIKAAPGVEIDAAEEIRRVVGFVARVRAAYPDLVICVDTWRASVGRAVCEAGADVLNDAWGGADPALVDVAAEYDAALICTHTGGVTPRTRPHRIEYDDVVRRGIARHDRLRRARGGRRASARESDRDRPGARLRQEHLPLPGGDPAARRDGRHRLAGAGLAVQQGLRRRDPRPAGRRAADRDAGRDRRLRARRRADLPRARGRRDPAGRRHGRGRSPAAGRPRGRSGGWRERPIGVV